MKKVPENVIEEMRQLALDSGVEFDDIKAEFGKVYEMEYLAKFDHDDRCFQAAMIMKSRRVDQHMVQGDTYEGMIISVLPVEERESKKDDGKVRKFKVGNAWGIFVKTDGEKHVSEPKLANMAFFDDASSAVEDLAVGKCYRLKMQGKEKKGILDLSISDKPAITEIELNLPDAADIIPRMYDIIAIQEAPFHAGGFGDFKVIRGRVRSCRQVTTKKNKDRMFYNVTDDSVSLGAYASGEENDFMVMCDPSLPQWESGSDLFFIGTISAETDKYKASMWANVIVPFLGIPRQNLVPKSDVDSVLPPAEEASTIDMSDYGEE